MDHFLRRHIEQIGPAIAIVIGQSWCSSKSVLASFLHSLVDGLRIKKRCCQKKDVTSRSQYLKVMLYVGWVRGMVVYDNSLGGR